MISYLHGKLVHKSPTELVIDVNGIGYHVNIPLSTFEKIEQLNGQVKIFTYMHVREDIMQLYGFATEAERELFRLLISVSGIGPKMAQGILSGMSINELKEAILTSNIGSLTTISGVGKKTAERLVLELRDKFTSAESFEPTSVSTSKLLKARAEAVVALMSLGYTRTDAERVLRTVTKDSSEQDMNAEELIKRALRNTSK
ncbi:MAG TPA: Holliday junction branch migration protein RuvA [Bacteroidota bacterium]|nr:Holliday junction branch migration protein RuvA [Bacteroidota bacterium]